jgi:hypothetical protein
MPGGCAVFRCDGQVRLGIGGILVPVVLGACGGGSEPSPVVSKVAVTPLAPTIVVPTAMQMTVAVEDAAGYAITGRSVLTSGSSRVSR